MLNCTEVILKSLFLTLLVCMNLKNKLTAKQHHFNTNLTKYNVQWGSLLVTYGAFTKFRNLTTINCKIKKYYISRCYLFAGLSYASSFDGVKLNWLNG